MAENKEEVCLPPNAQMTIMQDLRDILKPFQDRMIELFETAFQELGNDIQTSTCGEKEEEEKEKGGAEEDGDGPGSIQGGEHFENGEAALMIQSIMDFQLKDPFLQIDNPLENFMLSRRIVNWKDELMDLQKGRFGNFKIKTMRIRREMMTKILLLQLSSLRTRNKMNGQKASLNKKEILERNWKQFKKKGGEWYDESKPGTRGLLDCLT